MSLDENNGCKPFDVQPGGCGGVIILAIFVIILIVVIWG